MNEISNPSDSRSAPLQLTPEGEMTRQRIDELLKETKVYQGFDLPDIQKGGRRNRLAPRLPLILESCKIDGSTVLDIGCSNGYYCFELHRTGASVTGVDQDDKVIQLNRLITSYYGWDISFEQASFDLDFAEHLPHYDIIILFSVLHQIFNRTSKHSVEYCQKIVAALSRKCDVLFFEMGQSGELHGWSRKLALMGRDPKEWILENLFEGSDFYDVRVVEPPAFGDGRRGAITRWICEKHRSYALNPRISIRKLVAYSLSRIVIRDPMDTRYLFVATR